MFIAGEKLQILTCLSHHLLTFVVPRDRLDESWEKLQQAQLSYRDDKAAEKRREKEFALEKYDYCADAGTFFTALACSDKICNLAAVYFSMVFNLIS